MTEARIEFETSSSRAAKFGWIAFGSLIVAAAIATFSFSSFAPLPWELTLAPLVVLSLAGLVALFVHLDLRADLAAQRERRERILQLCEDARSTVHQRVESRRLASPAIRAEQTITGAIRNLHQMKADANHRLDQHRAKKRLTWWFDLTRPDFAELDEKIEQLEAARAKLIQSGDIARTNDYYRALNDLVDKRTSQIQGAALAAIPKERDIAFVDDRIVQNALLLSALSVPVSAWADISQAGSIYDALREVNGNYTDLSDAEIWLDTLTMSGPQLAGLSSLTKGALFEAHVAKEFDGELFEHFNHPDTDIVIDGVEYQIKATDSVAYIESVPEDIEVISTSEVAEITSSIDGGLTNLDLTDSIDLALGGTVIDLGDTALDAVLTGIGGTGLLALLRGAYVATSTYKETGELDEALVGGGKAVVVGTARSAVTVSEIAYRSSAAVVSGASKVGRKLRRNR